MQIESYHYERNNGKNRNYFNKTKLELCIDSIIRKEGYISCDVQIKPISTDGGNYLGNIYEINIKGKTPDGEKEVPIFIKAMSPNVDMDVISLDDVYAKELFMYTELGKVFNELQDEANVPINERFKSVKYYDESYSKAIILENITKRGFRTRYRMDCVTLDMAEASIKQLAKFHGLSFVIKERRPQYYANKIKTLKQPYIFGKSWDAFKSKFTKTALEYLDGDIKRRVEDKISDVLQKFPQYMQEESTKRCVCHGDYKINNVMIKEMDNRIIEAIIVDYQLIYYGFPIYDFFFFIYTGTDFEFRQKHMTYLKYLYFETLSKYMTYFNLSMEIIYPRQRFEREFEEKRDYGLMISVFFLPFAFASEEELPDLSKESFSELEIALNERFKERIVGAVQEFIELGYL